MFFPQVRESLLANLETLRPYTDDLIIATERVLTRQGPGCWTPCGVSARVNACAVRISQLP
jgi:hypothetical protein